MPEVPEEEIALIVPDSAPRRFETFSAKVESLVNLQDSTAAVVKSRRVGKARSSLRSPVKQDVAGRNLKTAVSKPSDRPVYPTIEPLPTERQYDRSDSAAIATAPSAPARFADSFNETATSDMDSIPRRIGFKPCLLGPFFAALILMSCFVFILSLPGTRARIYLWRGNPEKFLQTQLFAFIPFP